MAAEPALLPGIGVGYRYLEQVKPMKNFEASQGGNSAEEIKQESDGEKPHVRTESTADSQGVIEQEQSMLLKDVLDVSPQKPLGYLSRKTIEECGSSIEDVQVRLRKKGIQSKIFFSTDIKSPGDVLFAFDPIALDKLLAQHRKILEDNKWPVDAITFVDWVANRGRDLSKIVPPKTALYTVIADAFADYKNPGRLFT